MIELTGSGLSIADLVSVAREGEGVTVADGALAEVRRSRARLAERIEAGETMYGVNTGVGANADEAISAPNVRALQVNLVRSHAFGVGDPLPADAVRGMMLLRLNSLLSGNSGIRTDVVELLAELLDAGVVPRVPRKGSVSSSGDLAPLAHLGLVMVGEGRARLAGDEEWRDGGEALAAAGVEPIELEAKEGLAIVNGTNLVTAMGALAVHDARRLVGTADAVGALSLEANRGLTDPFRAEIHELRGHPGQTESARRVRELCDGSDLVGPSDEKPSVQDEYSLRCIPQVHGATRDAVERAAEVVERELNAVTDNPLVLDDGDIVSGGNFHAQPVALALDSLTAALAELANVSERRIFGLTGGDEAPEGGTVPRFLVGGDDGEPGLTSGFMIPQVTAAALVSENKTLAHPDAVDSIPTSDNQEDHVSMGANAANHLAEVVDNVRTVLAIEAFAAYQALHHREADPGDGTAELRATIAEEVDPVTRDRVMTDELEDIRELIRDGRLR